MACSYRRIASSVPAFETRDLRAGQRGAVLEILRAVLRPVLKLPVVRRQASRTAVRSAADAAASQSAARVSAP